MRRRLLPCHAFPVVFLIGVAASVIPSVYASSSINAAAAPLTVFLVSTIENIQAAGQMGAILYTLFFALCVALCVPCTPLEMIPGLLFGFTPTGLLVAMVGKHMGNLMQVLLARTLLFRWTKKNVVAKYAQFRIIERMVQDGGFSALVVVRTIYLPLYVKNFGLGALDVPVSRIMAAAIVSGLPFSVVWTFLGSQAQDVVGVISGKVPEVTGQVGVAQKMMRQIAPPVVLGGIACLLLYVRREWRRVERDIKADVEADGPRGEGTKKSEVLPERFALRLRPSPTKAM
jgi:uncharacterized membrane protein YdjX (TVP38/TMEM64 family)